MSRVHALCASLLVAGVPTVAQALQATVGEPASQEQAVEKAEGEGEAGGSSIDERQTPAKPAAKSPKRFVPKEKIPADSAISFPVDI